MLSSRRRAAHVALWIAFALAACDGSDASGGERDAGSTAPARDAAREPVDNSPGDAGMGDAGMSAPWMPPSFDLPADVCSLAVGAECDGHEDCADGQFCCGEFRQETFSYASIGCADECEGTTSVELCHPGDTCRTPDHECRRSLIIPFDFVSVCALPATVPPGGSGRSVAGEVACGDHDCAVGAEKCCLRARYDFTLRLPMALEPYCAPLDASCACEHVTPPDDAGTEDGSDAGTES